MKHKFLTAFFLFLIFCLALFLRIYFSYGKVFSEPIKYIADDGVYHMRLVENELLGGHFPHRIYFDPYTYFPYGTYIHFTPLYDQLLAGVIWLFSFGKPTLELINKIAPFYPAVLGSLMVFLIYFIGKSLWGKKVGLFSSFLMAISPHYLFRSLLGATDHHVAEVLFSTLSIMFLIFLLKTHNQKRKFWLFTLLTGFSLGLYFLSWNGALLFLFIFFVFIISYYLIEYLLGNQPNWILFSGSIIFLITLIMITPFFNHPSLFYANMYNLKHLVSLVLGIFGFIIVFEVSNFIKQKGMNRYFLPVFLVLIAIFFLIGLKAISPFLFEELKECILAVNTSMSSSEFARQLTSEMQPVGIQGLINTFFSLFFLSLIALGIIIYQFIKKRKPEHLLILIWTLLILLMTGIIPFFGQNKYSYYLACNISLLSGFLIVKGFEFGWRGLKIAQKIPLKSSVQPYFLVGSLFIIFNIVFFLLFPFPFNIVNTYPGNLPMIIQEVLNTARNGVFIREDDWYSALSWLRENTPDPGVDYYALYQGPGVNKETGKVNPYSYPEESYGVLARWDVGHMITYYSHRIPNSNPFQQGIGRKEKGEVKELGAAVFFLETEEEKAIEYLNELRTKYIITDYVSANPEGSFLGDVKWSQGNFEDYSLEGQELDTSPNKFDNSMIVRLHILDGREETTEREVGDKKIEFHIKPLDHFRLVYESKNTVISPSKDSNDDIKAVKVFEYVKGAKILGRAESGTEVIISTEIETNQGRKFVYQKSIKAKEGYFEFIVPYSTFREEGRLPGQTQFEVFAKPYKIKIGDKEIEVNVSEIDILEGKTIKI